MTTLEDMERAGRQAADIRVAQARLKAAQERLDLVNKFGRDGQVWRPELCLRESDRYGIPSINIRIAIPFGVIQQQALDAVRAARREVIMLGDQIK